MRSLRNAFHNANLFILVITVGTVHGLMCNQCGAYNSTSVTPCLNLRKCNLKECPPDSTHCAKYFHPNLVAYDCAIDCVEQKTQWSIDIHCCNVDKCNGASSLKTGYTTLFFWTFLSAAIAITVLFVVFDHSKNFS